jgi:hypothetical protein
VKHCIIQLNLLARKYYDFLDYLFQESLDFDYVPEISQVRNFLGGTHLVHAFDAAIKKV